MDKNRVIQSKVLANALVWIGFDYERNEDGYFLFKRTREFDRAFKDLHYLRSLYYKNSIK